MSNHASSYCQTLHRVTKVELINALYQARTQLVAAQNRNLDPFLDHNPAIATADALLRKAGHIGFVE